MLAGRFPRKAQGSVFKKKHARFTDLRVANYVGQDVLRVVKLFPSV